MTGKGFNHCDPNKYETNTKIAPAIIPVMDALDQAIACQENIFVIAILLEDCGTNAADSIETCLRSGAGRLIANEARKLDTMLRALEEHYPRSTKRPRSGV